MLCNAGGHMHVEGDATEMQGRTHARMPCVSASCPQAFDWIARSRIGPDVYVSSAAAFRGLSWGGSAKQVDGQYIACALHKHAWASQVHKVCLRAA